MGSGWTRRSPRADDAADARPKKHTLGSIAAERAAGGAAAPKALAQLRPQRAAAAIHDAGARGRDLQPAGMDTVAPPVQPDGALPGQPRRLGATSRPVYQRPD
jgi:hypothetical protein